MSAGNIPFLSVVPEMPFSLVVSVIAMTAVVFITSDL
jgi:hypothetical protein